MMPDRLHPVSVTLRRYGATSISATTYLPDQSGTPSSVTMQEEPWRANASVPRPDGMAADDTRLFVSRVAVYGARDIGTPTPSVPDRIEVASATWEVREVVRASGVGPIPALWHAYCVRVRPDDVGPA